MTATQQTVLIVDDEAPIRRLSQRLLQRKNYRTLEAENGSDGLQKFAAAPERVDAVLLDLNLPDGSGKDWAVKFRELRPEIPIIFFTGSNAPGQLNDNPESRCFFLKKPFTPSSMDDVIKQALGDTVSD